MKPNLPIKPVRFCTHLQGKTPGKLPAKILRDVVGGGKLELCAANAWEALVHAATKDGVVIKATSTGDLYRTYASQLQGFLNRYSLKQTNNGTRTFEGSIYYLKDGFAPLATPGKSMHNMGLAVDVANANGKTLAWLAVNAPLYGFSWEVLPQEPWHIRYTQANLTPPAVSAYLAEAK